MSTAAKPVRTRAIRFELKTVFFVCVLAIVAIVVIYPFLLLLINSFATNRPGEPSEYGLEWWRFALSDKSMLTSLWNTGLVWLARNGIGFPIGILIAWLIARTDMPWGRWLEFFFWVSFFIPALAVAQAWTLLLAPNWGVLNTLVVRLPFVDTGPFNINSFWGIVWAHLGANTIAIKVMLLAPAFRNMDASLEEASRIAGASALTTLRRVTLPVLFPALVVVLALSTIYSFRSAEIEVALGLPVGFFVFGSKMFDLILDEPPLHGAATALGVTVLVFVLPLIVFQRWAGTRRNFATVTGRYQGQVLHLRRWKWPVFAIVLGVAIVLTILPGVLLVVTTFMKFAGFFDVPSGVWTTSHWTSVLGDPLFKSALRNSFILALGSASLGVFFFALVAYIIVRARSRVSALADYLSWIPHALPGTLLAVAWLWVILQTPLLQPLYQSMLSLIVVQAISGLTLGVAMIKTNILQIGTELEEASYVSGGSWWYTFRRVIVPLLMPIFIVVWIINFVHSAGTAVVPAMLAGHESRPLGVLQLQFLLRDQHESAAVVGVIVILFTVGVAIVARVFGFHTGPGRT